HDGARGLLHRLARRQAEGPRVRRSRPRRQRRHSSAARRRQGRRLRDRRRTRGAGSVRAPVTRGGPEEARGAAPPDPAAACRARRVRARVGERLHPRRGAARGRGRADADPLVSLLRAVRGRTFEDTMTYTRISADCHIDMPWIPSDLFTANASAGLRDRMPYVTEGPDGPYWTCKNGTSFGLVGGVGPSGQKLVPGQNYRVDKMAAVGLYADGKRGIRRPTDPHLRLKDMEMDGVQAEVIFGILGAATRLNDHEAAREMFRIYNDWLVDFCRHYPDRQIGLACLPYGDIDAAVREVERVAKLGLRGLELSCSWDMEPMWHPAWEPLWQAVNEVNLPLHFHTFPSTPASVRDKAPTNLAKRAALFTGVSAFQMNLINILAALI